MRSEMYVLLWVLQGLLAAMFAMAGVMKATQPIDKLAGTLPYARTWRRARFG
ncbi:hypothetical protein [Streptomyces sp. NPDC006739]|uniref:hypothetical protein n=1 Tax=Streptomyces sp. NPDC006739 TaxID=3364763 RepID=UPI00369BC22A